MALLRFAKGTEGYDLDYMKEKYRERNPIIHYEGHELRWNTTDVHRNAKRLDVELTEAEALSILNSTFEDNEDIMQFINDEMSDTIGTWYALSKNENI